MRWGRRGGTAGVLCVLEIDEIGAQRQEPHPVERLVVSDTAWAEHFAPPVALSPQERLLRGLHPLLDGRDATRREQDRGLQHCPVPLLRSARGKGALRCRSGVCPDGADSPPPPTIQ